MEADSAVSENYVQLVLFDSRRTIRWKLASCEITAQLLDDYMHKFLASVSISSALFDGVSISKKDDKDVTHHVYLNRRRIALPSRTRALVVNTRSGHVISGYPIFRGDGKGDLWLGLFSKGKHNEFLSRATDEVLCVLLENLALAAEVLPPLHLDSLVARFEYLATILAPPDNLNNLHRHSDSDGDRDSDDAAGNNSDNDTHLHACLKHMMRTFSPHATFVSYPPSSLTLGVFSPSRNIPVYDRDMIQSLRPARYPVRTPWWVVAACILTKDGAVLKAEGVTRAIARVLVWRYACFSAEDKRLSGSMGLQEYRNGVQLRAWYTLGPICLCVLTSQAVATQASSVTRADLENLAERAFRLLEKVKIHYAA